ncbi:MAG: DUF5662 family protein [Cetobacterium sp.]|uniref:DUF5662 family protein n=1 Tax=Cetobacterium sp. TaxID=2071632 RepID=UPI003F330DC0
MFTEKEKEYFNYINTHRMNLVLAAGVLEKRFREFGATDDDIEDLKNRLLEHDLDKFRPESFNAYRKKFYTAKGEEINDGAELESIKKAIALHQSINRHHQEYYLDLDRDKVGSGVKMELLDMMEMLCDWESFAIAYGSKTIDWYKSNRDKMIGRTKGEIDFDFIDAFLGYKHEYAEKKPALYAGEI